jgi:chlorite dismutase
MTQTQEREAATGAHPVKQQAVHFGFYKLTPAWRQLLPERRAALGREFIELLDRWRERLLLVSYSLAGIRADCDIMLWKAAESVYVREHQHEGQEGSRLHIAPVGARYLFVYPFVKTRAWYTLPLEKRQASMNEHIRVGHKYPRVRLNTTYSFGLDDQEFVLAFESDFPTDFLDLVMELRETEASQYTLRDTPIFTCIKAEGVDLLRSLGVREA